MPWPRTACWLALLAAAPLCATPEWKLDLNARVRAESRLHTYTFNRAVSSVTDDEWCVTRLRVGAKGSLASSWTAYVQLQDSRELGSHRASVPFISGSEGDDPLDVRQAYVEHVTGEVTWRIGRQLLAFGSERLVGVSDWNNFARCFDAARVTLPKVGGGLDLFVSSVVQAQPGGVTGWHSNHSSHHDVLAGAFSRFSLMPTLRLEPYLLWRNSTKDVIYSAGAAGSSRPFDIPQRVATAGIRVAGGPPEKLGGFDYDAEVAAQTGRARGRQLVGGSYLYPGPAWLDHRAWALHAGAGYSAKPGGWPVRLYVEANRASGDRNPADGRNESFFNLFPTNHRFYGGMDVFSWKNMREVAAAAFTKASDVNLRLEHHWFALDNVNDTWFRSNATTSVRPLTASARTAPRRAGIETDLVASRSVGKSVSVEVGASYFQAGPYLTRTGGGTDARFAYLQTVLQW